MRTERSAARLRTSDTLSRAPIRIVKIAVSPIRTIVTACSFGVLGLLEDSTILIIWLMKVSSGLTVTFAVSVSLRTCEPRSHHLPAPFEPQLTLPLGETRQPSRFPPEPVRQWEPCHSSREELGHLCEALLRESERSV